MDWEELYRKVLRLIASLEASFSESVQDFISRLIRELKARGYELTEEVEREIEALVTAIEEGLRRAIEEAIAVVAAGAGVAADGLGRAEFIQRLMREAFERRWPDGLRLSDRLWRWREETRRAVTESLKEFIELGRSAQTMIFDLQRAIDRSEGGRHRVISDQVPKWLEELARRARRAIHTPRARRAFERTLQKVRRYAEGLADVGTRRSTLHLLHEIERAVQEGNEAVLEEAIRWRMYDKQLYNLKRIARTELTHAFHLAQIEATKDDPLVLGYKWKLSPDHPKPDICDWYASVDFGLGKGVWPKEKFPSFRPHPHCLCLTLPTVLPNRERGDATPAEFLRRLPPDQRRQLAPKWAQRLAAFGVPWARLIDPESGWFMRRRDLLERIGEERLRAMEAFGEVLETREWGRLQLKGRRGRETLELLQAHRNDPIVQEVLEEIERTGFGDSRKIHYARRRYLDGEDIRSPDDLDAIFERLLRGEDHVVYVQRRYDRRRELELLRYVIYNPQDRWLAMTDPSGRRITVHRLHDERSPDELGERLWRLSDLRF